MSAKQNHHHINYIELAATDIEAAKKFYSSVFVSSVAGAAGVHAPPGLRHGAVPVSPGLAGAHEPGEAAGAHVGAAVSPSLAGVHAPGSAAIPHIGSPASPGVTAGAAPHIGAPVSPGWAGVHTPSAAAIPHIGAPVSPGLAGVHGVGGGGGIGRR